MKKVKKQDVILGQLNSAHHDEGDAVRFLLDSGLPRLKERPQYLHHSGYWDGPLSGICLYRGKQRWFEIMEDLYVEKGEDDFERGRVYVVLERPQAEMLAEEARHNHFKKWVGTHTEYTEAGKRKKYSGLYLGPTGQIAKLLCLIRLPRVAWNMFYKSNKYPSPGKPGEASKILAWYSECEFDFDSQFWAAMKKQRQNNQ